MSIAVPAKPADGGHGKLPIFAPFVVILLTSVVMALWGVVLNVGIDVLPSGVYKGISASMETGSTVMYLLLAVAVAGFVCRLAAAEPARSLSRAVALAILPAMVFWLVVRVSMFQEIATGMLVFLPGLAVAVVAAALLARAGRQRVASAVGGVLAALALWATTMVVLLPGGSEPVDYAEAPWWLPYLLLGDGVLGFAPVGYSEILDELVLVPQLAIVTAAFALGLVVGAVRPRPDADRS